MRFITGLLFTFICLLPAGSMAQNKVTLSGKVIDQHGTPIAQATIAVENTTSGTYTDDRGKYSLQVAPGKHTFVVSFLGYQTVKQSLDIRQDKKQNFTLQESAVTLSSVEVYGKTQTQKVKEGAFAVNALDIKPIVNSLNNLNDLVNRTTGIKVREEGGVGSDFDLSINGLSGNSVRYFLDGMPLDTKGSGVSLANLPINIIDRIEIYKGVVPASLGTDALGGTINIITKQEKKDYLDVSYGIGSFHTHKADLNAQFVEKKREGSELGDYSMETISKGKYYYQIPATNDRFVKYQIKNNAVQVIAERPFKANSYKVRSYTHAWIDDNTLVIMSTNGKKDKILYTKLNAEDLTILAEGELNIPAPTNWLKLTSSGILTYRKSDNRLYYFYYWKETDGLTNIDQQEPNFHTAIINPSTMEVEKDVLSPIECEMAGSAYGELMQNCVMYDEADNLYLACFHEEDNAFFKGILLRINKGETEFDASYNGYPNADGKLLTIQYLEGNKALVYARNDNADRPAADKQPGIDAYSHYYAILDLTTGTKTRLSYDGKEIGYSGGRFSQRSVIFNNKAYIGVNTEEDANAVIYIYDIKTGNVEKGAEVDGRFYFDMIRVIEND